MADVLGVAGVASLVVAGFLVAAVVGFVVLGCGLLWFGSRVAR